MKFYFSALTLVVVLSAHAKTILYAKMFGINHNQIFLALQINIAFPTVENLRNTMICRVMSLRSSISINALVFILFYWINLPNLDSVTSTGNPFQANKQVALEIC